LAETPPFRQTGSMIKKLSKFDVHRRWASELVLIALIAVAAFAAFGTYRAFQVHYNKVHQVVRAQQNVRLMMVAERVQISLSALYVFLTHLATTPDLSESGLGARSDVLAQELWNEWQVTSLFLYDREDPDIIPAPVMNKTGMEPEVFVEGHGIASLLSEHCEWFDENPQSRAMASPIPLPNTADSAKKYGMLYSVPVLGPDGPKGILSAVLPMARIEYLLETNAQGVRALLLDVDKNLYGSRNLSESAHSWFQTNLEGLAVSVLFNSVARVFDVAEKKAVFTATVSPYGLKNRWWTVILWDEEAAMKNAGMTPPHTVRIVSFSVGLTGLLIALLLYRARKATATQREIQDNFSRIAEELLGNTEEDFFRSLVKALATVFGMRYASVCEVLPGKKPQATSLALWTGDEYGENVVSDLAGTPCEQVLASGPCFSPMNVGALFPEDTASKAMNVESYYGTPIHSAQGDVLGVLALMHTENAPRQQRYFDEIMKLFATRAGIEIERRRNEQALQTLVASTTMVGEACFENAAHALQEWLGLDVVMVNRMISGTHMRSVFFYRDGQTRENFSFPMEGTPCARIIEQEYWVCAEGISERFPEDAALQNQRMEGYLGIALKTREGEPMGTLCGLSRTPLTRPPNLHEVLRVLAARLSAEMERTAIAEREYLLESQLRQAQKMEAVGRLAGGVAHDFNNMLQAIQGYASLAMEELDDQEDARTHLKEVLSAGDKAAVLVKQLLMFSRHGLAKTRPTHLNAPIQGIMKMLNRVLGEHIEIHLELEENPNPIVADINQLEQIILNLCVNSRDAMPSGGILRIRTQNVHFDGAFCAVHPWARPGDYAMLGVEDFGEGIADEALEHIFEPFFTTKGAGVGTGLGLAMVYGIVQHHGGFIDVVSRRGQGTDFRLYFPKKIVKPDCMETPTSDDAARGGAESILVAEDEEALRRLSEVVLRKAGYHVVSAEDGEKAIERAQAHTGEFHLAVLDMMMPKKNGRQVAEFLQKTWPNIRILYCTGYRDDSKILKASERKFVEIVEKPISPATLLRKVRALLDVAREGAPPTDRLS
jgi:signal transduction histidine kinase/ActR/RegA family two-component response regulator